jgi:non-specific serine/threonine protein kinase
LVISERTAARHVENILVKLGLPNRTQVARWVLEQGVDKVPRRAVPGR